MQLITIDKKRYRKHLNLVITGCISGLLLGCLGISQLLIALFPDPSGSHFHWNLLGAIITSILIAWILNRYRKHNFMIEVVYVWELKQALNKINRKMLKLKPAAAKGDINALIAMQYSYSGSRLLWQLDDNTIVMEELTIAQAELDKLAKKYQISLDISNYNDDILKQF
ncbi:MAG: DUF3087 domain-containing protein [Paraglaciecola sp.]|uniref:DUF3087 domain-containing protein n=1 Tax=Paraglaciecola sp. TaxID=1920173 RepID=UPI0032996C91